MTIDQAVKAACAAKPNAFPDAVFYAWLSALDGRIAIDVYMMAPAEAAAFTYHYPGDKNTQLLVSPPHDELYVLYLEAKIDSENGEYNKYNNSMQLYNAAYLNFVTWFEQSYQPSQGYHDWLSAMGRHVDAPYYITAYGLAVKHGFRGSERDWIKSVGQWSALTFFVHSEGDDIWIYADEGLTERAPFDAVSEAVDKGMVRLLSTDTEGDDESYVYPIEIHKTKDSLGQDYINIISRDIDYETYHEGE